MRIRDFDGQPVERCDDGFERRQPSERQRRGFRPRFAALCLKLGGWTISGPPPRIDKYVIVAAPHTTWWDGFWMLAFAWWWGIDLAWMGKASITKGPLGRAALRAGLIPVDRSAPQGLVAQVVEQFEDRERLLLALPPEGTRAKRDYWKSGFYHIARGAGVPVCLSYLDYGAREAGFGPMIELSGDVSADMDRIRAFYDVKWSKHPKSFTHPRMREEDMSPVVELDAHRAQPAEPVREAAQG